MGSKGISRRDFVRGAVFAGGAAAASTVLGGCQKSAAPANVPNKWDEEADVVIVGFGGPRRNEKAQVLDTKGNPIPRLYSAGELGSIYGHLYNGGGNVAECMAFGQIAARNAVAEKPWS